VTVSNPSFEAAGTLPGEASGWALTATTPFLWDVAEFGIDVGAAGSNESVDGFENEWRNRLLPIGTPDWGLFDWSAGFTGRGAVPSTGHIVGIVFVIDQTVAAASDVTVTVSYNDENGNPQVQATTIPNGALAGLEYRMLMANSDTDVGSREITNIGVAPAMTAGRFHMEGGLVVPPQNESSKFEFSDSPGVDLFPADFLGLNHDSFESGWDNDAGFKDDFDALPSEVADMDGTAGDGGVDEEAYEDTWKLPNTGGAPFNESRIFAFHPFITSADLAASIAIVAGANDAVRFEYTAGGTTGILSTVVAPGTYTIAQLASAIETAIDTALDADGGSADNTSFRAVDVVTKVYLENQLAGSALVLRTPAAASLWTTLGIIPGDETTRYVETDGLSAASFDSGTPEAVEDYEEEWRSNENSKTAFTIDMPPPETELQFADFDVANVDFEDFESEWVLTL
jgi:hypothetical protein